MSGNRSLPPRFSAETPKRVVSIPSPGHGDSRHEAGKKLVIGKEICLAGEITACETLIVEGQLEATLNDSERLEIAEGGRFKGKVQIEVAEIKGDFEGELTARERLIIRSTGRVSGTVRYAEIEIERGGRMTGAIEVIAPGSSDTEDA